MEASEAVRAARQQSGLSQRALAAAAGVSRSVVADLEAGATHPRWSTVVRLLDAVGLGLALTAPAVTPDARALAYLGLSTSSRLHWSLGGSGRVVDAQAPVAWRELGELARSHHAVLSLDASLGVWLPEHRPERPLRVETWRRVPGPPLPAFDELEVVTVAPRDLRGLVPVGVTHVRDVHVPAPLSPAWLGRPEAPALRGIGLVLDRERARDEQGRRTMAHRNTALPREADLVRTTRTWRVDARVFLDARDRRDWRLGGPASLGAWLERVGYRRWGREDR